jgi:outer membrane cobalamin receptor
MKVFGVLLATALTIPTFGYGQSASPASGEEIVVTGQRISNVGTPVSASAGAITLEQVQDYPVLRPGELLQLVPGLVVVAHAAAGKANQYYLRGFELDHGDMFLTWVDGVPVNMVTHAHGPGYTDINWLIPEMVERIDYAKGPYYADKGDFANAGAADFHLMDSLPGALFKEEIGGEGYARLLAMDSIKAGPGTLVFAAEYMHDDGPWTVANNYRRRNGIIRYSQGDKADGFSVTAQGYRGNWLGGDQVPLRAITDGSIPTYDVINPTTGGTTSRYSLSGEWHETDDSGSTHVQLYGVHYTLDLFSDFTYFLADPVNGDEIRENDRRWIFGGHAEREFDGNYLGQSTQDRFGVEVRSDQIHLFLDNVLNRQLLSHVRADQVTERMYSPWWENKIDWNDWFSTVLGVRGDLMTYSDNSDNALNSGSGSDFKPSPKIGLNFGPWAKTSFYIQAGVGISSQDVRGIVGTVVPGPGGGQPAVQTLPITRNRGAEIGVHSTLVPGLDTALAVWTLESANEFIFDGDTGAVDASGRPGRRYGVEWNNRWQPLSWLDVTANFAISRAHYLDQNNPLGNQIPESVRSMVSGEINFHDLEWLPGATATLGWRYLGPRYLIEDGSEQSKPAPVFNAKLQYEVTPAVTVSLQILNLLNTHYYDAEYYYVSRLPGESLDGVAGHMVHPGEPREFRLSIAEQF